MGFLSFYWLIFPFSEKKLYCIYIFSTQNYILFKISASGLFLKFRKFQPRYSYKIYSYRKKKSVIDSLVADFLPQENTFPEQFPFDVFQNLNKFLSADDKPKDRQIKREDLSKPRIL